MYIRRRVAPINKQSPRQMILRNIVAQVASHFESTDMIGKREGWAALASITSAKNKVGLGITLTAQNLFLKVNVLRLLCTLAILEDAPTLPDATSCPALTITGTTTAGITLATPSPALVVGDGLIIQLSPSVNATVNFFKGPWASLSYAISTTTFPLTLLAKDTIVIGQRYHWRARFTNAIGQVAPPRTGLIDITA
jgi:hypothetical protein